MHEVLIYIQNYLQNNGGSILTYLVAGALISRIVWVIDKVREWEHTSTRIKALGLFSGVGSISDWIINNYHTSPLATLGNIGPRILAAALFMHMVVLSPVGKLAKKLLDSGKFNFLNVTALLKDAKAYRAEQAAVKPAGPEGF